MASHQCGILAGIKFETHPVPLQIIPMKLYIENVLEPTAAGRCCHSSPVNYGTALYPKWHRLTRLSVLRNLHTKHKQSTEYIRCRPFKPRASTLNSTLHIQENNQFENIICFDTGKLRNQKKHFHDLQNIYSVHRVSLYIC